MFRNTIEESGIIVKKETQIGSLPTLKTRKTPPNNRKNIAHQKPSRPTPQKTHKKEKIPLINCQERLIGRASVEDDN